MELLLLLHLNIKGKMRDRKLFSALAFVILGMGFAQTNTNTTKKESVVIKKADSKINGSSTKFFIKGKVTQTWSYCGGAAPTEEILEQCERPQPYNGKVFFLRKGKVNSISEPVVLSFTVNASGTFSFQLPSGVYSIFQEPQLKPFNKKEYPLGSYTNEEIECLKKWWMQPYYVLEIKEKDITNLKFEFHHECFAINDIPCLQYIGPMPP